VAVHRSSRAGQRDVTGSEARGFQRFAELAPVKPVHFAVGSEAFVPFARVWNGRSQGCAQSFRNDLREQVASVGCYRRKT